MRPAAAPQHSQRVILSFVRVPGLTVCGMRYTPKPRPSFNAGAILADKNHVLYTTMKERYAKRDKVTLWKYVTANTMVSKKVVRTRCERRLKVALDMALKARGFDSEGKNIADGSKGLVGTLELHALKPLLLIGFEDLKAEMGIVVDGVAARGSGPTKEDASDSIRKGPKTKRSKAI